MRLLWAMTLACLTLPSTSHAEAKIVVEEFRVPHEGGIEIYVRNKRPEGIQTFASDRIAVLVHGATYPGNSFDLGLAGKSWMDYLAERGFDVYALDLPGYGRSTRPAIMEQPAEDNPPFLRTADAVTPNLTGRDVTISLALYALVYTVVFGAGVYFLFKLVRAGPAVLAAPPEPGLSQRPARPLSAADAD